MYNYYVVGNLLTAQAIPGVDPPGLPPPLSGYYAYEQHMQACTMEYIYPPHIKLGS